MSRTRFPSTGLRVAPLDNARGVLSEESKGRDTGSNQRNFLGVSVSLWRVEEIDALEHTKLQLGGF